MNLFVKLCFTAAFPLIFAGMGLLLTGPPSGSPLGIGLLLTGLACPAIAFIYEVVWNN